ncbi:hypothetical protein E4U23_001878 [Claviceps purpurea]|nr:hypothetical protein E4U27_008169 [Claviceps purpurea]KAG6234477.1 hypothetical protein E4U26_000019 [Claviceps purpurea]KAG6249793.1 hypothetical protein E4U23_001878 [Claviceps purpurea]KAG6305410.1 hypothetical protein E4U45_000305 [Claviceps purpurea]
MTMRGRPTKGGWQMEKMAGNAEQYTEYEIRYRREGHPKALHPLSPRGSPDQWDRPDKEQRWVRLAAMSQSGQVTDSQAGNIDLLILTCCSGDTEVTRGEQYEM